MYFLIYFLIILIWLTYRIIRNHLHLSEIPMPHCNFLIGHIPDLLDGKERLNRFTKYAIEYGGIFRVYIPPKPPSVFISDPNLLQIATTSNVALDKSKDYNFFKIWLGQGLITTKGNYFWRSNRKMFSPCFGSLNVMKNFVPTFELNGDELLVNLEDQMSNTSLNIFPLIKMFTINVMCESSMGISKLQNTSLKKKYFKCIETLQKTLEIRMTSIFKRNDFLYRFTKDFKKQNEALKTANEFFDVIMEEKLNKVKNEDDNEETCLTFLDMLLQCEKKQGLTKEYIREEINTFLFAGHDTTATGIAFTLYALARNPHIQEKVFAEQIDIFGKFNKDLKVTYLELKRMNYLNLVINEALRMYPPIPLFGRKLNSELKLGDKYCLPKNLNVGFFIYGCHHNPKYFPEPDKFIPERFLNNIVPYSYMPFSNGPRNCIGNKFAMLQMKSCISKVIRNFKLMPPKPDYEIELSVELMLVAKNGIRLLLEKRLF